MTREEREKIHDIRGKVHNQVIASYLEQKLTISLTLEEARFLLDLVDHLDRTISFNQQFSKESSQSLPPPPPICESE